MSEIISLSEKERRSLSRTSSMYRSLVMRSLEKMNQGMLRITLPDGSSSVIGRPGSGVSARIDVINPAFFKKCVLFGDVGFGESYVDGDWETDSIERVISWAIENVENSPGMSGSKIRTLALNLLRFHNRLSHLLRPNSVETSRRNIADHYDLGNDFYRLLLDPTLTYSSARFTKPGQSLESAQVEKYEALCRKLSLKANDTVLEIGSGWGGFACHAVQKYGCRVQTITISEEQFKYARVRFEEVGISDRVEIKLMDYRKVCGNFDKVVSIEMMEAIGDRYLEEYFQVIHRVLKPDGLVGLQYITVPDCRHGELRRGVDWIQKHIFPGSLLLSVGRVNQAINRTGSLFLHHLEDMGASYARTLHAWWESFNGQYEGVRNLGFDARFIRKWNYYLQYCEAAFARRNISVVQAIYTQPNNRSLHIDY